MVINSVVLLAGGKAWRVFPPCGGLVVGLGCGPKWGGRSGCDIVDIPFCPNTGSEPDAAIK